MRRIWLFLVLSFLFTSCFQDVYRSVRGEVKLEKGTVTGLVNSVVEFNGSLVTQNGKVYYKGKNARYGAWNEWTDAELSKVHVGSIVTDGSSIYAMCIKRARNANGDIDTNPVFLKATSVGGSWSLENSDKSALFQKRRVSSGFTVSGGNIKGSGVDVTLPFSILSATKTKDSLLIGTDGGGIYRVALKNGAIVKSTSSFSNNADAIMYPPYSVPCLLCLTPDKLESECVIYAANIFKGSAVAVGANWDNRGLWAYYPERGNWNRE